MAKDRSLRTANLKLGPIQDEIAQVISKKGNARVLELGCGRGLVMLELQALFEKGLSIVGINFHLHQGSPEKALQTFKRLHPPTKDMSSDGGGKINFPSFVVADLNKGIPFADDSFDFVYSQVTVAFLAEKLFVLEEVNRVLTREGQAHIQMMYKVEDYPSPEKFLLDIRSPQGKRLDCEDFFNSFKSLKVCKGQAGHKYLRLRKDRNLFFNMSPQEVFDLTDYDPSSGFVRSIFRMSNPRESE